MSFALAAWLHYPLWLGGLALFCAACYWLAGDADLHPMSNDSAGDGGA